MKAPFFNILVFTLCCSSSIVLSTVVEDDHVKCLKGVKSSLDDLKNMLSNWDFGNNSLGFICNFYGVSCWNDFENRITNLELRESGLLGQIPEALKYCGGLLKLDLSSNNLYGKIPPEICSWMRYLVTIDLSSNDLSGSIPVEIVNCSYMNSLVLSNNKLSGSIPYQLSSLRRLRKISVANNELSGAIPPFGDRVKADFEDRVKADFEGNEGICGKPLDECNGLSK